MRWDPPLAGEASARREADRLLHWPEVAVQSALTTGLTNSVVSVWQDAESPGFAGSEPFCFPRCALGRRVDLARSGKAGNHAVLRAPSSPNACFRLRSPSVGLTLTACFRLVRRTLGYRSPQVYGTFPHALGSSTHQSAQKALHPWHFLA